MSFEIKVGGYGIDLYKTKTGHYCLPVGPETDWVMKSIKADEIFDEWVVDKAREYSKPNTAILDVGANFGQMSVLFSRMVGVSGKVYSFECFPDIIFLLKTNLAVNGCDNSIVISNAVYDECGREFTYEEPTFEKYESFGSYGLNPTLDDGKLKIKTITIDSLNIDMPVSFMKVDVQGADLAAMRGAKSLIEKFRPAIVYEYEERYDEQFGVSKGHYQEFVDSIGYQLIESDHDNYLICPK